MSKGVCDLSGEVQKLQSDSMEVGCSLLLGLLAPLDSGRGWAMTDFTTAPLHAEGCIHPARMTRQKGRWWPLGIFTLTKKNSRIIEFSGSNLAHLKYLLSNFKSQNLCQAMGINKG